MIQFKDARMAAVPLVQKIRAKEGRASHESREDEAGGDHRRAAGARNHRYPLQQGPEREQQGVCIGNLRPGLPRGAVSRFACHCTPKSGAVGLDAVKRLGA